MSARPRPLLAAVAVSCVALAGTAGAQEAEVRTDTPDLGGYSVDATASPLLVLLDDPSVPVPRPPDSALIEADPSYTRTTLSTGPQSRALSSTVWPGTLFGDGINTATGGRSGDYPVAADARFPGGPVEKVVEPVPGSGVGMFSRALGLDVVAEAKSGASPNPNLLGVGQAQSRSSSTVLEGVGASSATSDVSDVSLMGGVIRVRNVHSTLESRSDGTTGATIGTTTVTGLEIGGMGFVVDDNGVRPVQSGKPAPPVAPGVPAQTTDPLETLGITVEPPLQSQTIEGSTARRVAQGLRITVDTVVFRQALNATPLSEVLIPIFSGAPPEFQGELFYLLSATPKITFIFAAASTSAAANLPIVFDFPPLAPAPAPLPPATTPSTPIASALAPAGGGGFSAPPAPVTGGALPPDIAETIRPVAAPRAPVEGFGGIAAGLLLLGLLGAAGAGVGLNRLRDAALAGGLLGKGCTFGAPGSVPDLRGA
jgi:hypothetical protein